MRCSGRPFCDPNRAPATADRVSPSLVGGLSLVRGPGLRARRCAVGLAAMLTACVPSFEAFSVVEPVEDAGVDAGPDDAGRSDAGFDAGFDAGVDAGPFVPTALDLECPEVWAEYSGSPPGAACRGREITALSPAIVTSGVAIARREDGRLVVAYGSLDGPDIGSLVLVGFPEADPSMNIEIDTIEPEAVLGEVVGVDVALATEAPHTIHLAYWLRSDFGHEVRHRTLIGDALTAVETLAAAVGRTGVVDVAIDSRGEAVVVYHDDTSGLIRAVRQSGGVFGSPVTLRTELLPELEGAGSVAVTGGEGGTVNAVYQWGVTLAASSPSYSAGTLDAWMSARTLDNRFANERISGVGVDIALIGEVRVVAYLDWESGIGEIRFATFTGLAADPVITNYRSDMTMPELPGAYPIDLEVDSDGLLHLLTAEASTSSTTLEYHRQTRVGDEIRWVVDRIEDFTHPAAALYVDMVVGPDRRPHIVYFDPSTAIVRYATVRPLPL